VADEIDSAFLDPARGASAAEPGAIGHPDSATQINATGATIATIQSDLKAMIDTMAATNTDFATAQWVMSPATAANLASLTGQSDLNAFPFVTARGGSLFGLPVLTSSALDLVGSPGERAVLLVDFAQVAYVDDGLTDVALSEYGAVQLDDAPAAGAQTLVSLWQNGLVGAQATRLVSWRVMRPGAVVALRNVTF